QGRKRSRLLDPRTRRRTEIERRLLGGNIVNRLVPLQTTSSVGELYLLPTAACSAISPSSNLVTSMATSNRGDPRPIQKTLPQLTAKLGQISGLPTCQMHIRI